MSVPSSSASLVFKRWHASSIDVMYSKSVDWGVSQQDLAQWANNTSCVGVRGVLEIFITHFVF